MTNKNVWLITGAGRGMGTSIARAALAAGNAVVATGRNPAAFTAAGPDNPWFRRALEAAVGRIQAGGIEQDVAFDVPAPETAASVTAAYHAKYDRYGPSMVGTVVSAQAVASTLRLVPRAGEPSSA